MGQNNGTCCCGSVNNTKTQDLTLTNAPEPADDAIAECQVMAGTPVVKARAEAKGLYRDHEGQRYWFCCPGCAPAFDADPAKYAYAG